MADTRPKNRLVLFNNFLRAKVHGIIPWEAGSYCIVNQNGSPTLFTTTYLVESEVLDYLERQYKAGFLVNASLRIFIKWSPVSPFTERWLVLAKAGVSFEIVCAAPYRMHEVSCSKCTEYSARGPRGNLAWYQQNTLWLQMLMAEGITVRGFGYGDWQELSQLINGLDNEQFQGKLPNVLFGSRTSNRYGCRFWQLGMLFSFHHQNFIFMQWYIFVSF